MDFSDQMLIGMQLATEFPEVGEQLRQQFQVVLLDEYQDTSVAQRLLLTGLFADQPIDRLRTAAAFVSTTRKVVSSVKAATKPRPSGPESALAIRRRSP